MDLTFRTARGRFNYRVGAIIIHDGRILLMKNEESPYLYSVGGRVHFDETTEEAVIREVYEEIGIEMSVERPLFFQEQFFDEEVTGEHVHEIGVYYLMQDSEALGDLHCDSTTERGMPEELVWIPLTEIGQYYIVPESVSSELNRLPEHFSRIVEIDQRPGEKQGTGRSQVNHKSESS